jgi:Na+/H+ antiporter NhaD/arsenite permease-like protein
MTSSSYWDYPSEEYEKIKSKILIFDEGTIIRDSRFFRLVALLLVGTIVAFIVGGVIGIPIYMIALTSAVIFFIVGGAEPKHIVEQLDWNLILFFIGIFIIVGGVDSAGILESLGNQIGNIAVGNPTTMNSLIQGFNAVFSGLVDEVSVVAVMVYTIPYISTTSLISPSLIIWAVLYGANVGTSLTPIGGVPNMIALSELEKENIHVSWWDFMKTGIPITVLRLAVGIPLLMLFSSFLGWGIDLLGPSLL